MSLHSLQRFDSRIRLLAVFEMNRIILKRMTGVAQSAMQDTAAHKISGIERMALVRKPRLFERCARFKHRFGLADRIGIHFVTTRARLFAHTTSSKFLALAFTARLITPKGWRAVKNKIGND
jgi:hypothetical protein